ncbi:Peptidase_S24 domain-containing protein [Meloidogyne graminicola]|uniref:Mitochondrial inner membrane protease subunit n=1 Tax=Meloidogyne graminicola TaxID=189291 RepID=A0A8S9ZZ49_9BILA|nr:Peptidase_S24 domain-containing protein [Meloidogyne graminicola]
MVYLRRILHATGIVCTCTAFFDLIGCPMSISGTSMMPTLVPGDLIWVSKISKNPSIGDIVVFTSPSDPTRNHIKRVVALSGDTAKSKQGGRVLVPNNHVWALSDNLKCPTVLDSRAYGPVNNGLIVGKAKCLIWPLSRWSTLKNREENEKTQFL